MLRILLCVLACCVFTSLTQAESRRVTLDGNLSVVISEPEGSDAPSAAVLLVHGWVSNADEVGDLYKHVSARLAELGIASVRVNIRGESERERSGYRLTSTFASRVRDADIALNYMTKRFPEARIGLLGFSLGGSTVLALTGNYARSIHSVVLWSSAGNPDSISHRVPADKVKEIMLNGEAKIEEFQTLTMTKEHFLGMLGHDVFSGLEDYRGALLAIRGSEDFVAPIEDTLFDASSASQEESVLLYGANHTFNIFEQNSHYGKRVVELSTHWFEDTLLKR